MSTVKVPANIDVDDKILYGLTARQVAILAPLAVGLLAAWHGLDSLVPMPVLLIACAVIAASSLALVLGRRDGTSLDRLLWAAIRHPRGILAPGAERVAPVHLAGGTSRRDVVSGLRGPVRAVIPEGLDLGTRGVAVGVDAIGVNFSLRSPAEQSMLIGGFARLVHAIPGTWQAVVSTRPTTMDAHVQHVRAAARRLPQGQLRRAAREYVSWLDELVDSRHLLRREVTIVVTAATLDQAERSAAIVADTCAGIGVTARVLDGAELAARLRSYIDPYTTSVSSGGAS